MDEEDYKYSALDNLQYSKTLEAAHLIALSIVVKALIATSTDKKGLFKKIKSIMREEYGLGEHMEVSIDYALVPWLKELQKDET
jgi:hypothetical protein